jgi:hypothetical protein
VDYSLAASRAEMLPMHQFFSTFQNPLLLNQIAREVAGPAQPDKGKEKKRFSVPWKIAPYPAQ